MRFFFVWGQYLGATPNYTQYVHGQLQEAFGKCFFCPKCGELWAGAQVQEQDTFIEHMLCDRHEPTATAPVPGSLWLSWDNDWNAALPVEVLEREFLLLTNGASKNE